MFIYAHDEQLNNHAQADVAKREPKGLSKLGMLNMTMPTTSALIMRLPEQKTPSLVQRKKFVRW